MENKHWENRERRRELLGLFLFLLIKFGISTEDELHETQMVSFATMKLRGYPWLQLGWEDRDE